MKIKYKILLAIITVGIGICLMTYQSYALWVANYTGGENIVNVGCFEVTFEEVTNPISLNNTYPVSDTKGLTTTPYTFTIKNTCTIDAAYDVTLNTITTNTMQKSWIKYAIHKSDETKPTEGINLSTNENYNTATEELGVQNLDESIIIESGTLKGRSDSETDDGESVTYNVYLWMDETTGNEAMNTRFEGSINVISSATTIVPTAAETILAKGETDELKFDNTEDNNLRYIGANPNNYVSFNNELWRIIGVFNNIDDGTGTKETRLKIIRNEPIGNYSWDNKPSGTGSSTSSNGSNDWSDSRLMMLLNPGYETPNSPIYEYEGSLYYNGKSGTCYFGSSGATVSCDFTNTGLQSTEAKEMIGNAVWKLGGSSTNANVTASMFYERERGTTVYEGRPTQWTGKIGLMYPSDYGYATSGGETTNRETCLNTELFDWDSSSDCKSNDWLYKSETDQQTLTSESRNSYNVFNVAWDGRVFIDYARDSFAVSPTLYLNSNVRISGGEGTESSPYQLSL